jgi:uncharacterized membrane protein YqjE
MADAPDRKLSDVLQDIVGNFQGIVRSEVRLAKAEVKQEVGKARRAAIILAGGAVFSLFALGFLLLAGEQALQTVMEPWLASIIVAVAAGMLAAVLISKGKADLKRVVPVPGETVRTVKENVEWLKHQVR